MSDEIRHDRILVSEGHHLIDRPLGRDGRPTRDVLLIPIGSQGLIRRMDAHQLELAVAMKLMRVIDKDDLGATQRACIGVDEEGRTLVIRPKPPASARKKGDVGTLRAEGAIFAASDLLARDPSNGPDHARIA